VRLVQGRFGAHAVGDVLDLGDEVERGTGRVVDERAAQENPDDLHVFAQVPLFHLVGFDFAAQHPLELAQVGVEIVGEGDVLECQRQQFGLIVADKAAQRSVDL
jgi:hypothetical protein